MNFNKLYTRIFILILIPTFFSCIVPRKKFDELLAQKLRLETDFADLTSKRDSLQVRFDSLSGVYSQLKADTTSLGAHKRKTEGQLKALEAEHAQLNSYYKNLLTSSGKLNRDMSEQQQQLLQIRENLDKTRKANDSLSLSLEERERKVKELEVVLAKKDKAVQDLKTRISNALLNFKENDISVKVKNGKVYVSLAEDLLFGSGSVVVDSKGVGALQQLAKAIKDQKGINILIEGHTDNVPISRKSQYMSDNWDLSVMRATSITRILVTGGVNPKQVTAAGRGEFMPLAANETAAAKQKNRRTEIIITPDLDELFKILESN